MNSTTQTLTEKPREGAGGARAVPMLVLALDCDRPTSGSLRLSLEEVDRVTIGRSSERKHARVDGGRKLEIGVPDARTSSQHLALFREHGRWIAEDVGSKNGTRVNGVKQQRALLEDGDVIELGHTLFLFTEERCPPGARADDAELSSRPAELDGLATLNVELAARLSGLPAIAASGLPILVLGPTGSGKELAARAIHQLSGRSGAFVAVNAGALPGTLIEGELFGYRKGAFSGAEQGQAGLIRSAEGGTLFLDEIGELPLPVQATLLRALQEKEVVPLGTANALRVDVRIVAATHRDLEAMVASGSFREDLLARLTGYRLELPPLTARKADLGALVSLLLRRVDPPPAAEIRLSVEAGRCLLRYGWPRNIRELFQVLAAAVTLAQGAVVGLEHLPKHVREPPAPRVVPSQLTPADEARRAELVALLKEHRGNITRVAGAMGKARVQIQRWVHRYELNLAEFRQ